MAVPGDRADAPFRVTVPEFAKLLLITAFLNEESAGIGHQAVEIDPARSRNRRRIAQAAVERRRRGAAIGQDTATAEHHQSVAVHLAAQIEQNRR